MQPFASTPAYRPTEIFISEKDPLLPLNSQPVQPAVDCKTKTKVWLKEHVPRAFLYGFVFYFIFGLMQSPYLNVNYSRGDVSTHEFHLQSSENILAYNQNQFTSSASATGLIICTDEPSIPYTGVSEFHFSQDTFPHLSIDQKTRSPNGGHVSINSGNTIVIVDEDATDVSVKFDVSFNNEDIEDAFWIEQTEAEDKGLYSLVIRTDETYTKSACIKADIAIRVPDVAALKKLAISLVNTEISLDKGLTFEELAIAVANGHVEFDEGITTGKTAFAIANGHVSGTINTLNNRLTSSIANGHNEIIIKEINQDSDDGLVINLSTANGYNDLALPSSFDSKFSLASIVGRRVVESTKPEKIHRQRGGWGATTGYYGNNKDTKNSVKLETSSGRLRLAYE